MIKSKITFSRSEPIAILACAKITKEKFIDFLVSLNVSITPDQKYEGRISKNNQHVWLYYSEEELDSIIEAEGDLFVKILGRHPQTCIIAEIGSAEGSEQLILPFLKSFAQHWSCAISDLTGNVYSISEIFE
jgi:hypothetical protein